jgi:hypothetical protein
MTDRKLRSGVNRQGVKQVDVKEGLRVLPSSESQRSKLPKRLEPSSTALSKPQISQEADSLAIM